MTASYGAAWRVQLASPSPLAGSKERTTMKTLSIAAGTAASLLIAGTGFAQEALEPYTIDEAAWEGRDQTRDYLITPHGLALTVGAGATHFFGEGARDLTEGAGGYLDVRAAYGTRTWFGGEAAYTLTGRSLSNDRFANEAPALFGHSAEGLLRGNIPLRAGRLFLAPFAVAGLGWTAFVRTDEGAGEDFTVRSTDHVGTIPVGAGLALSYKGFRAEARFMYRPTYGEDVGSALGNGVDLQSWMAGAALGAEF
jgi:hypothetical protein